MGTTHSLINDRDSLIDGFSIDHLIEDDLFDDDILFSLEPLLNIDENMPSTQGNKLSNNNIQNPIAIYLIIYIKILIRYKFR